MTEETRALLKFCRERGKRILNKPQRLARYKKALNFMLADRDRMFGHGLCYALSEGNRLISSHYPYYPSIDDDMKIMYPEIWKHKPVILPFGNFWWNEFSDAGYNSRVKVLRKVIKEMEG